MTRLANDVDDLRLSLYGFKELLLPFPEETNQWFTIVCIVCQALK